MRIEWIVAYLIKLSEELIGISTFEEVDDIGSVEKNVLLEVGCLVALCLLFFGVDQLFQRTDLLAGISVFSVAIHTRDVFEDVLGVQEALVDNTGFVAHADHENLGRLASRGRRLRRLDLHEERFEHEQERVVVLRAEHLAYESASFFKDLGGKLQGSQRKLNLHICVEVPVGTHIGRTIIEHDIALEVLELLLNESNALGGSDIALECDTALDGLDGVQIDTDFD